MRKVFLDANVMADWMLIAPKIIKMKNIDIKNVKLSKLWKKCNDPKASFEILELLRNETIKNFKFFTSDLTLAEVGDVIFKEFRSKKFRNNGIPFRYIPKMIKRIELSKVEINKLMNLISLFRTIFIDKNNDSKNKITIHNKLKEPRFPLFLTSLFRIETYDAYIISQAFDAKCKFFVTKEEELRREVKFGSFQLISPEKLLELIRKDKS